MIPIDTAEVRYHPINGRYLLVFFSLYDGQEFVKCPHWIHIDNSAVKANSDQVPYLGTGFTGEDYKFYYFNIGSNSI